MFGKVKERICNWLSCTETDGNWGKNTDTVEFEIKMMKVKSTVLLLSDISLQLNIMHEVTLVVKVKLIYVHLDHLHGVGENPGWYRKKSQVFVNNPAYVCELRAIRVCVCVCLVRGCHLLTRPCTAHHLLLEEGKII